MKKILLMAVVAISAMTASAQKYTINVETMAPNTHKATFMENLNSVVANVAPKANLKKAAGETINYIEVNVDYTDGVYEEELAIPVTNTVEVTLLDKKGEYEGVEYPMIELTGFGSGYCTCTGYLDEEGGHIYIPRQVAYEYKDYGEMYIEAAYVNASNQLAWDGLDVILTKNEETGGYICWDGEEAIGHRVGWIITMTGEYDGSIWTYGIESDLLVPNGVENGYYNWGSGYAEESYPVFIADGGDEVVVYNFLGMAALGMIIEDGEVYIPTLQPVAAMPAAANYPTDAYGEYFRTYAYDVVGEGISLNDDADYSMAALDGNRIDMGDEGYIGVWSKFDEDQRGYRIGIFAALNWTLNEGLFIAAGEDGINNVNVQNTNNRVFNLSGQQVSNAVKGIYIKNGKKYIVK